MFDLIFLEGGTHNELHRSFNVKLDEAIRDFADALAHVRQTGNEVEIGIRSHDPRAMKPKTP